MIGYSCNILVSIVYCGDNRSPAEQVNRATYDRIEIRQM